MRLIGLMLVAAVALSACAPTTYNHSQGASGRAKIYRIPAGGKSKIQFRMLDSVNALRTASGLGAVKLDSNLNAAAETHSKDMSRQGRPWHFGSDGSSPIQRVARTGYPGIMLGENISETFETEIETLGAWMEEQGSRDVIMSPTATDMGFSYHQDSNGKLWWTLLMGGPGYIQDSPLPPFPQG